MKKRVVSIMIVICLVLANMQVYAENSGSTYNEDNSGKITQFKTSYTEDNFRKVFNVPALAESKMVQSKSSAEEAYDVDYSFSISEASNENFYKINLDGTISIGSNEYVFNAAGDAESLSLDSSRTLLQGPLYGILNVDGMTYKIVIGFQGIKEEHIANFGMTVYIDEQNKQFENMLFLTFGDDFKDDQFMNDVNEAKKLRAMNLESSQEIESMDNQILSTQSYEPPYTNTKFVYYSYAYGYFDKSTSNIPGKVPSGVALKMDIYRDQDAGRIALTTQSFTSRFTSLNGQGLVDFFGAYGSGHTIYDARIDRYKIGLMKVDGTSSSIDNWDSFQSNQASGNAVLKNCFLDVVGLILPITWSLDSILSNSRGSISSMQNGNHAYADVNISDFYNVNFDNAPMRISFNIDKKCSGTSNYRGYSEFTYFINTDICLFYIDTDETQFSFPFTMY